MGVCCGSGAWIPGLQCPHHPAWHLYHVGAEVSCLTKSDCVERKERTSVGFSLLAYGLQSWEATTDPITTVSLWQLLGPWPNCSPGLYESLLSACTCSVQSLRFAQILPGNSWGMSSLTSQLPAWEPSAL